MWQVESPTLARTKKMNISKKMCFLLPGNERKKASKIMCHFSVEGFCCRWMQLLPRSLHETFDLLRASIRGISLKIPCLILMYGVIHGYIYIYMCVFRIPFFLSYTCTCTPPKKDNILFARGYWGISGIGSLKKSLLDLLIGLPGCTRGRKNLMHSIWVLSLLS